MEEQSLKIEDLEIYSEWVDDSLIPVWEKCLEYLINEHECYSVDVNYKKINENNENNFRVNLKPSQMNYNKLPDTIQRKDIVELAGIGMALLITNHLMDLEDFRVCILGEGYDYIFETNNDGSTNLEISATEMANAANQRLNKKINKFENKHPDTEGYISVSCFPDNLHIYWGHNNA